MKGLEPVSYPGQFTLSELPEEAWNRIFPTSLKDDVTSEIAEHDWEGGWSRTSFSQAGIFKVF